MQYLSGQKISGINQNLLIIAWAGHNILSQKDLHF